MGRGLLSSIVRGLHPASTRPSQRERLAFPCFRGPLQHASSSGLSYISEPANVSATAATMGDCRIPRRSHRGRASWTRVHSWPDSLSLYARGNGPCVPRDLPRLLLRRPCEHSPTSARLFSRK